MEEPARLPPSPIIDEISGADAIATAKRLLALLEAPIEIEGHTLFARGSIGIALAEPMVESPDDLLRDADAAMYSAKAAGRGTWAMFEPAMRAEALGRFEELQARKRPIQSWTTEAQFGSP